jgi:hypothetical protein
MQADCTANPFCVNCKKEGHLFAMCSIFSKLQEQLRAGFGGDGKGFYCLEVAEEELQKPKANSAIVCIEAGDLSAEQVEAEFKDLVDEVGLARTQNLSNRLLPCLPLQRKLEDGDPRGRHQITNEPMSCAGHV